MSEKIEITHPYSDIVSYKLVSGKPLTEEQKAFENGVNEALANNWELFWAPNLINWNVVQFVRRAGSPRTAFVPASTIANEQKPVTTAQDKIPPGLSNIIGGITAETKNATVQATVLSTDEVRNPVISGVSHKVQNLIIEDLSGKIKLVLWDADTGIFKAGDKLEVEKGYVTMNEFRGNSEIQLQKGKFGKLRKL